jgi:hypothetical protein
MCHEVGSAADCAKLKAAAARDGCHVNCTVICKLNATNPKALDLGSSALLEHWLECQACRWNSSLATFCAAFVSVHLATTTEQIGEQSGLFRKSLSSLNFCKKVKCLSYRKEAKFLTQNLQNWQLFLREQDKETGKLWTGSNIAKVAVSPVT